MAEKLREWLLRNGGFLHEALKFQALPGGDRGIVAQKDIKRETLLVYIPLSLCLHMPRQQACAEEEEEEEQQIEKDDEQDEAASFLESLATPLSPFLSTVLLLMYQLSKGSDSKYGPFLSLLPRNHDCTLGWSDEEVAELAGTSIADTGRTKTAHEYDSLVRPVMERRPDLWPPSSCEFEAFVHAVGMVQSRAFHVTGENWLTGDFVEGEELYLIPGIDMINHSSHPQERNTALRHEPRASVTFRRAPDQPPEDSTGGVFRRDVAAGEQILQSYGDLNDAQLLQTYGFVEDPARPNPQNKIVRLPANDLQKAIQLLRRHHKPGGARDDSWIKIEEVEARLLAGSQRHDDLFKLAAHYVTGMRSQAEAMILFTLLGGRVDGMRGAPNARVKAADATGRLRMAAVVREAEKKALERLTRQIESMLLSSFDDDSHAGGGAELDIGGTLGDREWEPEDELRQAASDDSEDDEEGSEEEAGGSDEGSEGLEDEGEEEEEEEEEKEKEKDGEEGEDAVEASSSQEQVPEASDRKRGRGSGAEAASADESALLCASVLPATKKRGRRSSTVSLRTGDPVRKRLKF